ncbi:hypothetical protein ACFU98_38890 [Streptomyces sp. NPDC057575]|uniref:hypothetical protein n=1 Tax=unclassified Streptomyces TaxID=2593676 RepID=UPI0036BF7497
MKSLDELLSTNSHGRRCRGVVVELGTRLDNVRKRAAELPEQRPADLDELGMRW